MCYIYRKEIRHQRHHFLFLRKRGYKMLRFFDSERQRASIDAQKTTVLLDFLSLDISSATPVLDRFRTIPSAIYRENPDNLSERFVYIEGWRKDKVLLVAHADTYWDASYHKERFYVDCENRIKSIQGIGADDRCGCAALWCLKDLGHSLLIVDGEEIGAVGSQWLMNSNVDIADRINFNHAFIVEFDRQGVLDYKCYNVGTDKFRTYIELELGFLEPNRLLASDIVYLCRDICGVNLSIGYYEEHCEKEYVDLNDWLYLVNLYERWLSGEFPEIYFLGDRVTPQL